MRRASDPTWRRAAPRGGMGRLSGGSAAGLGCGGAAVELGADGVEAGAVAALGGTGAGLPDVVGGGEAGMGGDDGAGIVEIGAIAGVEIGFAGHVLGEHEIVVRQFDVVIDHDGAGELRDRCAVDEMADGDEDAVEEDGVFGREKEVVRRHVLGDGVGADADGPDGVRIGVAGGLDAAMWWPCGCKIRDFCTGRTCTVALTGDWPPALCLGVACVTGASEATVPGLKTTFQIAATSPTTSPNSVAPAAVTTLLGKVSVRIKI